MNKKRLAAILLIGPLAAALCACSNGGVPVAENAPELTLPPAVTEYVAPIGDAALEFIGDATLFLPRHDGTRLVAVHTQVSFSAARPHAESLTRALLNYPGDGVASPLGGGVRLALNGVNPVEVSLGVATVNLAASALQLDRKDLYIACQAIANTLTELSDISYVNVLVMDKPVGLDIANTLPTGTFSRSAGQDVGAVYEQLLSRRVQAGESAAERPLSSNVTLYFPLSGTEGVMSEVRAISFGNQVFSDMVASILRELAAGPQQAVGSPALPLLADLLTLPPSLSYSEENGGQIISLHFAYNLDEMLEGYGLTRAQSMASLCYTLCTFFPNAAGISVTIGDAAVTTLMLAGDLESSVSFSYGIQRRADFSPLLYDRATLYFADETGRKLKASERPVPFYQRSSPRALLVELSKGPKPYDSVAGLLPVMARDALADADILGLAIADSTLIINFAPSFAGVGAGMDGEQERLLAYAIVNTLCCDPRIKSLCAFLSGAPFEGFSGQIYWPGRFYPLPG